MGTAAVFLDAGYIDKVLKYDFGEPKVDFHKLALELAAPDELLRTYYYNCLPYQSNPPTEEEKQRYARAHRFTTALAYLPRFEVRLGNWRTAAWIRMANPSLSKSRKGKITNVAIFTGDSDLIPAVEAVKREGVLVTLWHGSYKQETTPSRELVEIADERKQLT